jgi:hypothetical protein
MQEFFAQSEKCSREPSTGAILSQIYPVHTFPFYLPKIHSYIIFSYMPRSSGQNFVSTSRLFQCVLHAPLISSSLIRSSEIKHRSDKGLQVLFEIFSDEVSGLCNDTWGKVTTGYAVISFPTGDLTGWAIQQILHSENMRRLPRSASFSSCNLIKTS